ncbi:MAG: helix-turn-helix domain-containing protein [Lachnospiraceae bacterium]
MTIGKRLRFIRTFRGMTQKELGEKLGFDPGSADIRISQYESDNRKTIKEPMLREMAQILNVNYNALKPYDFDDPIDVMESFFWFEIAHPMEIALFEFKAVPDGEEPSLTIPRNSDDNKIIESPISVMFALPEYRHLMNAWKIKKDAYYRSEISYEEYVEWKLQWDYLQEAHI